MDYVHYGQPDSPTFSKGIQPLKQNQEQNVGPTVQVSIGSYIKLLLIPHTCEVTGLYCVGKHIGSLAHIDGLGGGKLTCGGPIDLKVQPVLNIFLKYMKIVRNLSKQWRFECTMTMRVFWGPTLYYYETPKSNHISIKIISLILLSLCIVL